MKEIMTVRLDSKLKARLEALAKETDRSKSFLAVEAIDQYLSLNEWQIAEIKGGINEADTGNLVKHDKIKQNWENKLADLLDKDC